MPKRRVHIAPLVVVMLLVARCTLADSVDDYLRQQMKEKYIPGAVLIELKNGKIINNNHTVETVDLGACRTEVRCEVQGLGFIGKHGRLLGEWLGEPYSVSDGLTVLLWSAKGDRELGTVNCSKAVFSNLTGTASRDCAWHKSVSTRCAHSLSRGS